MSTTRLTIDHRSGSPARHPEKVHRPDNPIQRKPDWIRVKAPTHPVYHETKALIRDNRLVTVCEEAACPNIGECWSQRHATMMIMGDTCTRACSFCNVRTGQPSGLAADEPARVADAVAKLGLRHVVITSVDRDDLDDGGAAHFAAVQAIRPPAQLADQSVKGRQVSRQLRVGSRRRAANAKISRGDRVGVDGVE